MTVSRRPPATDADLQRAVNLYEVVGSISGGARQMGVAHQTFSGWLKQAKAKGIKPGQATETEEHAQVIQGFRDRIRELELQLRTIRRDSLTAQTVRKTILDLKAQPPKPPKWTIDKKSLGQTGVPLTVWSDWHWGEVVDPAQVNGINEYNLEIGHQRARRLVDRVVNLCKNHMVNPDYPGIVVCLGGDMLSGDIHAELSATNELPTMPVFLDLFEVLAWALETLADEFGRVFVPVVPGNHSRLSAKPIYKGRNYSNWDWLLGCFLERHFVRDDRIKVMVPEGTDAHFEVVGHRFLLSHGDSLGARGGDGIIGAVGPIIRGDVKTRGQSEAMGLAYDTLLIGHWHQSIPMPRVVVNGCLVGYNEYAQLALRARPEPPTQSLMFIHPQYGPTAYWPIYLEDPRPKAKAQWVSWPE